MTTKIKIQRALEMMTMTTKVNRLPKSPRKGKEYEIINKNGRRITFKATGKEGFGKWRILSNEEA